MVISTLNPENENKLELVNYKNKQILINIIKNFKDFEYKKKQKTKNTK